MTLRHMRIFVAVCDCGSVTAAAERLFIAQSAASLAVSELERYYGQPLFDRVSNRLHITEIGKEFYGYASHIVSLFDSLETGIKNWDTHGILRVGTSVTIGIHLMPGLVAWFGEIYPKMRIKVTIDNSEAIERLILQGEIDFGLIEGICGHQSVVARDFMDDELVFICAPNHPWAFQDAIPIGALAGQRFILREKGSAAREIFDSVMELNGLVAEPLWQSISTQAIVEAVSKGIGLSVLPLRMIRKDLDEGKLASFHVQDVSLKRKFSLIYHQNKLLTKAAERFIGLLHQLATDRIV